MTHSIIFSVVHIFYGVGIVFGTIPLVVIAYFTRH